MRFGSLRTSLLIAPLAMAPVWAAAEPGLPAGQRDVRLLVVDFVSLEPFLLDAMQHEVEALLAPAGLGLRWKSVSPSATSRRGETRIIVLPERARGGLAGKVVLGSSHSGTRGRAVWVYYPTLMKQVGLRDDLLPVLSPAARRRVGLAFGRVVAHELIHALLPGWPHTRHGLMAPGTTGPWLLRRHVRLDETTLAALRLAAEAL